jgi:tRNA threonylcarbamoyladenosine biosynthesis protein TsaB
MVVLALDTSTRAGSCAIVRETAVVREERGDPDRSQAARLPGDLMRLLARTGVVLHEIDAFAVVTGPGSFTGLRVGIATMQGLAFACNRPLIGVSGLDALAAAAGADRVVAWVDAWRGEVYSAVYQGRSVRQDPEVAHPSAILERLDEGPWVFVGDGAASYRELVMATLGERAHVPTPPDPPIAGHVGRLASALFDQGHRPPPHAIRPLYVRRPDAELAREASPRPA